MDELKTSVQLAVHEQKDPLLIYKLEAFNLFRSMLNDVNKEVISFLFKGDLPQQQVAQDIHEARNENRKREQYTESRNENEVEDRNANNPKEAQQRTETVVRETPKINRNDTVTIKHVLSGKTESMKYKKAESMLAKGDWVLVND